MAHRSQPQAKATLDGLADFLSNDPDLALQRRRRRGRRVDAADGRAGAVIVAAWLVESKQRVVENMAPVLTMIFTPLFAVMLTVAAITYAVSGVAGAFDRGLLATLAGAAWLSVRFLTGRVAFHRLDRWQTETGYLPVFAVWAATVVAVLPPVFAFR